MADLDLTLVQSDPAWEAPQVNLHALAGIMQTLPDTAELVLLPEMFATGFSMEASLLAEPPDGPISHWMAGQARDHHVILAGSVVTGDGGHYYNRLLWMLPNGSAGAYDKRHLFCLAGEDRVYTAGDKRVIARVKGWKVCLSICYDLRFPAWLRQPADPAQRYDLLVCVANWPESRKDAWTTLLRARAIENQCYVAGVNRTGTDGVGIRYHGASAVFGPEGEAVLTASGDEAMFRCLLRHDRIRETRERFPFLNDGDRFRIFDDPA